MGLVMAVAAYVAIELQLSFRFHNKARYRSVLTSFGCRLARYTGNANVLVYIYKLVYER